MTISAKWLFAAEMGDSSSPPSRAVRRKNLSLPLARDQTSRARWPVLHFTRIRVKKPASENRKIRNKKFLFP